MRSTYLRPSSLLLVSLGILAAGCGGAKPTATDVTAGMSTGSTATTSTTTSPSSGPVTTGSETTTTGGMPWMHQCPEGTTTSYLEDPYDPEPCQYGGSGQEHQFCSCRHHELCVTGLRVFFPSGMSGYEAAGVCAAPCETTTDCPAAPAGVTAVPECRELAGGKWCVLDCSGGKTCGEGVCSEPPEEVCVGTYVT